jgi:beta-phosphoglucomutase-like phosphatase (HAD superfamily)
MTVADIVAGVPKPVALAAAEDQLGRLQQEEVAIFGRLNKARTRGTRGLLLAQAEAIERQIAEDDAKSATLRKAIAECRRQIDAQRPEYAVQIAAALAAPRRDAALRVLEALSELQRACEVLAGAANEIRRVGSKAIEPPPLIFINLIAEAAEKILAETEQVSKVAPLSGESSADEIREWLPTSLAT